MSVTPPEKGFIFWPVGTGDSTTVRISCFEPKKEVNNV